MEQRSTDPERGLSAEEVKKRRAEYGENTIEEERENPILRVLEHFWGPIPWMIEAAAVLSAVAQRWEDFGVIFVMLLINGGVGYWHDRKATSAIEALKERLAPRARVIREGERREIDARELVPGDVSLLRLGEVVPADVELLSGSHLSVDESSLTGESLPVSKEESDVAYSGTTVKRGEARGVVTATGRQTRFARTIELVEKAEERSHFQRAVLRIGYFLIAATLILDAIVIAYALLVQEQAWTGVLLFVLALTVAGIPQALPAVLSVTMSVGANRLARMKAIVSRLAAMDEMAGLEILCADKTGTLTKNQLELQEPVVLAAESADDLVRAAALTCREESGDPIDEAVLEGVRDREALSAYEIGDFRPFDPTRKRAEATVTGREGRFQVAKGAPQAVLDLAEPGERQRSEVRRRVDELGEQGFRALGVARKPEGGRWSYLGLLPLLDPPRDDSAEVVRDAEEHGIDVRMVTGDHAAIGRQVGRQIGLGDDVIPATELFGEEGERAGDRQVRERVLEADGFAEVTPEHKFRIIKAFQAGDRIVGMTGDGVNDAPALEQADVGIAVSGATDAARSAADLVLTEKGLGVITRAVEEARRIFERMTSYATFRITETTRVLLFVSIAILAYEFYPVTPIMIVLLAILNDIPIITIAWDRAPMPKNPVRWHLPRVLTIAGVLGVGGVLTSLLILYYLESRVGLPRDQLQTALFLKLLVAGHMTIFLTRNEGWLWDKPWPSWSLFLALEGTQIAGTLIAVYGFVVAPIGWGYALGIWGYAIVSLLLLNALKVAVYRLVGRKLKRREERSVEERMAERREKPTRQLEAASPRRAA